MRRVKRMATLRVYLVAGLLMSGSGVTAYPVFGDTMNGFALLVGQQVWAILGFVVGAMLPLVVCIGTSVFAARQTHRVAAGVWAGAIAAALYGAAFVLPQLVTRVAQDWAIVPTSAADRGPEITFFTAALAVSCGTFGGIGAVLGTLGGFVGTRLVPTQPHRPLGEQ